jgi:hypothetical protein
MRSLGGLPPASPGLGQHLLLAPAGATPHLSTTAWKNQTGVISPLDFGADPTGQVDSSGAMSAAMESLAKLCSLQRGHLAFNVT